MSDKEKTLTVFPSYRMKKPKKRWARVDLNYRLYAYQAYTLTN